MKIEIPGYGPVELDDLKADVERSNGTAKEWADIYTHALTCALINKIEELQDKNESMQDLIDEM